MFTNYFTIEKTCMLVISICCAIYVHGIIYFCLAKGIFLKREMRLY